MCIQARATLAPREREEGDRAKRSAGEGRESGPSAESQPLIRPLATFSPLRGAKALAMFCQSDLTNVWSVGLKSPT
jgi:hypothetical protein